MLLPLSILTLLSLIAASAANSTAPIPHPDPDSVADELHRLVQSSHRRALASTRKDQQHCPTGNPIDDCWLCSTSDWRTDRQRLADCGIGFGGTAAGGKGGPIYVVTDSSDNDPVNPTPGTLRHAVIQEGPLWITFASSMSIHLAEELLINSFKTLDARGVSVHIAGGACITLQYVSDIIIHGLYIHDCVPAGEANVRSSPTHYGWRTKSDGDGISIYGSRKIWIDHCELSRCADGLIDAIMGSTAITISNNYFWDHDDVMLMGHSDEYAPDLGMQVTIVFNKFGAGLVQRMPRCRLGYFHIVNNDYTEWEMYAIGGSASPTVNSQGNRYIAPADENAKGMAARFEKAESVEPKTAALVEQLTVNAGVIGGARSGSATTGAPGGNYGGPALAVGSGGGGGGGGSGSRGFDALGMVYVSGAPPSGSILSFSASAVMVIIFFICMHLL